MDASELPVPLVRPMLATLGELPRRPGWGFEFKWDGVRAVAYLADGRLWLVSRNDRDVSTAYPELRAGMSGRFGRQPLVLDGEIVAVDAAGRPSFSLLQQRMHVRAPSASLLTRVPVQYYVFDVLHHGDRPTVQLPYARRRELLSELDLGAAAGDTGDAQSRVVTVPPWWPDDGADLMATAADLRLEGVIAKRLASPYQPGARSRDWIKTPINKTVEVIIAGWKPGEGRRAHLIGSLMLGMYDQAGRLRYVGNVGTGFSHQMLLDLARQLRPLHQPSAPFDQPVPRPQARDATWVRPELVGEVAYRTLTPDSRLRHPAWRGLRPDREPAEVTLDALR
jgi:bifunctional non-homologous end joining protein LigD